MRHATQAWRCAFVSIAISAVLFCLTSAQAQDAADPGIKDPAKFDQHRPLARELEMSVGDGFTLTAVGDCIISRPLSQYAKREEGFAKVLEILRRGDVTYGNMETSILDLRRFKGFPYTGPDDVTLVAAPAVAKDMANMGFDLVSRANNHALDWGVEGMRETSHWLDDAGLAYAGTGENAGLARAAGYFESAKGRIGIVSMASTYRPTSEALSQHGAAPGRPGISALAVKRTIVVPPDAMKELLQLRRTLYPGQQFADETSKDSPKKLVLFGFNFELGDKFGYRYEMDANDRAEILRNIRQAKEHSDFLIATIHSHEPATSSSPDAKNDFNDTPAGFVREIAKAAIDAGADAFMVSGIHHLGPIEIYKGRPIFYGMGDFFWSDIQEPLPADLVRLNRQPAEKAFKVPSRMTDADLNNLINADSFAGSLPFEAVITESRFDKGRLAEIRLYPLDLGYGMRLTESGIPRIASPAKGVEILKRIQAMSEQYGTKIAIESVPPYGNVGIIRP
jgi:poly-gamma-glutamate capsule biosynthesis protein CapA/YwtB (metallophosphatase superfamily)